MEFNENMLKIFKVILKIFRTIGVIILALTPPGVFWVPAIGLLLSGLTGIFRRKLNEKVMTWINRLSGAFITGFGLIALVSILF